MESTAGRRSGIHENQAASKIRVGYRSRHEPAAKSPAVHRWEFDVFKGEFEIRLGIAHKGFALERP
jgi:hypothetical protein